MTRQLPSPFIVNINDKINPSWSFGHKQEIGHQKRPIITAFTCQRHLLLSGALLITNCKLRPDAQKNLCRARSGFKLIDTLMVLLKDFLESQHKTKIVMKYFPGCCPNMVIPTTHHDVIQGKQVILEYLHFQSKTSNLSNSFPQM